jgi:hypothetical protein
MSSHPEPSRRSAIPGFEFPFRDDAAYSDYMLAVDDCDGEPPPEKFYDSTLFSELSELVGNQRCEVRAASFGRGVETWGLILQVLTVAVTIRGAISLTAESVQLVAKTYGAIRNKVGGRPCITLGAAPYLASADLLTRHPDAEPTVMFTEELEDYPDDSFTGMERFWVGLSWNDKVFLYVVTACGSVRYVGDVPGRGSWHEQDPLDAESND